MRKLPPIFILAWLPIFLKMCLNTAYFAENWKYCSKIIFKCVNSAMGPIFNESLVEKEVCGSREQYMGSAGKTTTATEMCFSKQKQKNKKKRRHRCISSVSKQVWRVENWIKILLKQQAILLFTDKNCT